MKTIYVYIYQEFYKLKSKGNRWRGTAGLLTLTCNLQGGVPGGSQWVPAPSELRREAWNLPESGPDTQQNPERGGTKALVLLPPCLPLK